LPGQTDRHVALIYKIDNVAGFCIQDPKLVSQRWRVKAQVGGVVPIYTYIAKLIK
jgi:hypothetical protein